MCVHGFEWKKMCCGRNYQSLQYPLMLGRVSILVYVVTQYGQHVPCHMNRCGLGRRDHNTRQLGQRVGTQSR